mgnify:CR=1 FL=1
MCCLPHVVAFSVCGGDKNARLSARNSARIISEIIPKTIGAMKGVELDRVRAYRVKYYADLVTRKPDLEKFYFGWFRRALEV